MSEAPFHSYFSARRKQLQDWDATPPVALGVLIFVATIFELALSFQLMKNSHLGKAFPLSVVSMGVLFLMVEILFVSASKQIASYFNKKGWVLSAWTFLNIGLLPYLLFLPVVLCAHLAGFNPVAVLLLFLLLSFQVLSNWRKSVEVAYELSKLQSAAVVYVMSGLVVLLCVLTVYISVIKAISAIL